MPPQSWKSKKGWKRTSKRFRRTGKYKRLPNKGLISTRPAPIGFSSGTRMFPPKFVAKLKYTVPYSFAAGTTDTWSNAVYFSMTNPLDPYSPAGGSSASHFAQMAGIYNNYRVLKSYIVVTGAQASGNSMFITASQTDDTTSVELAGITQRISDQQTVHKMTDNEHTRFKILQKYNARKTHGAGALAGLAAHVSTNPAENTYCALATANVRPGAAPSIVDALITIVYTVLFSEIKEDNNLE